jgi:hypothetical protein
MSKDLFKQAIAEAKSVREAAIANAKEALEESLTPHLKDMLAAKLQEMETSEEVEEAKHDDKDESIEEAPKKDEAEITEEVPAQFAEEEEVEADDDSEESEEEAPIEEPAEEPADDMPDGDEDISKLSIDQFKDIVRDIIAQESGAEHGEEELPVDDMDGGDIEGMGDEPSLEDPALDGAEEEEIDLDELLRELESETSEEVEEAKHDDKDENVEEAKEDHKDEGKKDDKKMEEEVTEESNELQEALETIETLKKDLNEVNLLNSKLLYVNKIFKSNDLSESQKVNIIAAFDKAESVKEVKLVFETVSDSVVGKKQSAKTIKESKAKLGMASKAGGTTAAKPEVISEVSDTVRRMQKLAGIITN